VGTGKDRAYITKGNKVFMTPEKTKWGKIATEEGMAKKGKCRGRGGSSCLFYSVDIGRKRKEKELTWKRVEGIAMGTLTVFLDIQNQRKKRSGMG